MSLGFSLASLAVAAVYVTVVEVRLAVSDRRDARRGQR